VILVTAALSLRLPYFAIAPGPAQDVSRLIKIRGAPTTPVRGQLLLTTVSLHEIRVAEAIRGWFDHSITVLSRSVIIPPGTSEREVEERTTQQMEESQVLAAAAALRLLGYDIRVEATGARIRTVNEGVPASSALRSGDVVVAANGRPVRRAQDVRAALDGRRAGDAVRLRIVRGGETLEVTTRTVGRPEDPSQPVIGITVEDFPRVRLPLAIDIESLGIGGPSAGLMFALGIYDLLNPADLVRGRVIAGTGEIDFDGEVGPVGGVRQKVESARRSGATVFLVPSAELREACELAEGMTVIAVERLSQAVGALRSGRAPAPSCT
jgi:PDZ domain-containing protein